MSWKPGGTFPRVIIVQVVRFENSRPLQWSEQLQSSTLANIVIIHLVAEYTGY